MLIVFGAISMELHVPVNIFPTATTQAIAPDYTLNAGGKAANQAFAATRSGAKVAVIGKTGDDDYSKRILNKIRSEGVVTSGVGKSDTTHTGLDVICMNDAGDIQIIKSPGANAEASEEQIPEEILTPDTIVLIQSDISMRENTALLAKAKENGARTMMNLSPSININAEILNNLDYLILNSRQAAKFAKKLNLPIEGNTEKIAQALSQLGQLTCIITMSEKGSIAYTAEGKGWRTPALKLETFIDHNGAEDVYCGTFAACIQASTPLQDALKRAGIAATLACEHSGGQQSFPYLSDINEKVEEAPMPSAV